MPRRLPSRQDVHEAAIQSASSSVPSGASACPALVREREERHGEPPTRDARLGPPSVRRPHEPSARSPRHVHPARDGARLQRVGRERVRVRLPLGIRPAPEGLSGRRREPLVRDVGERRGRQDKAREYEQGGEACARARAPSRRGPRASAYFPQDDARGAWYPVKRAGNAPLTTVKRWGREDSNLRRRSQPVYSRSPLATRELPLGRRSVAGLRPATRTEEGG